MDAIVDGHKKRYMQFSINYLEGNKISYCS